MRNHLPVFFALAVIGAPVGANAQSAKDIVGSWGFVLNETTKADGTKVNTYGTSPKGIIMFDADGRFSLFIANPERPKFASGSRLQGTAEENKAAVQGSISYFGKYSIDQTAKAINFQIEASSFPNWDGVTQTRPFSIAGDELRFTNSSGSSGGSVLVVMKRLK